jgi:hypothetical protein
MDRELQMVQLSGNRCSCIAILWVSLVSFAAITLCVASQLVFIVIMVYFVMTQSGNFWTHRRIVRVTLQLTVGWLVSQSVSQLSHSVLALSPSGTHDQILVVVKTRFCRGASSPKRGWVSHVPGHSPCQCEQYTRMIILEFLKNFKFFGLFYFFFLFFFSIFLGLQPRFCTADHADCSCTAQGYNHSLDK